MRRKKLTDRGGARGRQIEEEEEEEKETDRGGGGGEGGGRQIDAGKEAN
jgi:hypothetical protein